MLLWLLMQVFYRQGLRGGKEILELTKMNWNSSQFDNAEPITLHAAIQVGSILKHTKEDSTIQHRYSYYM